MNNDIKHYWFSHKCIFNLIYKIFQWLKENNALIDVKEVIA